MLFKTMAFSQDFAQECGFCNQSTKNKKNELFILQNAENFFSKEAGPGKED